MSGADARLARLLAAAGVDALVSCDPGVVRLLTGHAVPLETGPSPFSLGAVVVAPGDAPAWLVANADDVTPAQRTVVVPGFTLDAIDRAGAMARGVAEALDGAGLRRARVGVDAATVPLALAPVLPGAVAVDVAWLGAVKTEAEIAAIARSVALADAGQAAARAASRAGVTELELWAHVRAAMEAEAGERLVVLADVLSGPRTADVGGPPGPRRMADGEPLLCDLTPRHGGMWADSCATWSLGSPSDAFVHLHRAASEALAVAKAAMRPGVLTGEVDAAARAVIRDAGFEYPHHTGHGVGFAAHEEPRIVPEGEGRIEAGMVVALEPGAYQPGLGARVEQVGVVTSGGFRVLSRHALSPTLDC